MQINPDKVQAAIAALKAAAEAFFADKAHVLTAAQCVDAANELQASLSIAGVPRVFHVTGTD
jgi:hypothetical protein